MLTSEYGVWSGCEYATVDGGTLVQEPSGSPVNLGSMSVYSGVRALGARYCGLAAISTRKCIRAGSRLIFVLV